jgi:hypothetical protein
LIPHSILRSIRSEPGSIGIIPSLSFSFGSRKRLRLIQPRLAVPCIVEDERPNPVAVGGLDREYVLRLDDRVAHPVGAKPEAVAKVRVLELGQHGLGAVHVEAEQVLDPVVRVDAAAR